MIYFWFIRRNVPQISLFKFTVFPSHLKAVIDYIAVAHCNHRTTYKPTKLTYIHPYSTHMHTRTRTQKHIHIKIVKIMKKIYQTIGMWSGSNLCGGMCKRNIFGQVMPWCRYRSYLWLYILTIGDSHLVINIGLSPWYLPQ